MYRRLGILIIICFMIICFLPICSSASFSDLDNHWSKSTVMCLAQNGIVNGYADGSFRPDEAINIDAFIKMIINALGTKVEPGEVYWASTYLDAAKSQGLIKFGEYERYAVPATRADMARIVVRAFKGNFPSDIALYQLYIKDYSQIPDEFKEYVVKAVAVGLIEGYPDGTFKYSNNATRAEAVTIIDRLIKRNEASGFINPNAGNYTQVVTSTEERTSAGTAELYVSTSGDDNANGSKDSPFKTIEKARDTIREMKKKNTLPTGGVTVYLRAGTYKVSKSIEMLPEDSGTTDSRITYTAFPGEKVRITGGVDLTADNFKTLSDDNVKKRLVDKSAASKIVVADLKELGITDYGTLCTRGYHYWNKGRYMAMELLIDGKIQTLARWPNEDYQILPNEDIVNKGGRSQEGGSFKYTYDRPSLWKNAKDIWVCGAFNINYEKNFFPVKNIDTANNQIILADGKLSTYYSKGYYFFSNLLEELDKPGEYYIDRDNGKLYMIPPTDLSNALISLTMINEPIFTLKGANNITFKNLIIDSGRGYAMLATSESYKIISYADFIAKWGMTPTDADKALQPQTIPGHIWDGFDSKDKGLEGLHVENCEIRGFGQGGLIISGNNSVVKNCDVHDIGGVGIFMQGGDLDTLTQSGDFIQNNDVHDTGYNHMAYHPNVVVTGVGVQVLNNALHDAPHTILNIQGNDHFIAYNDIYRGVLQSDDMDMIYLSNADKPWERGVIIKNNKIHDYGKNKVGEGIQFGNSGIRTDNQGHALTVEGNIFYNAGYQQANQIFGVTAQGGNNIIRNNMFIDTSYTYLASEKYDPGFKYDTTKSPFNKIQEKIGDYINNPAYKKYPELQKFFDQPYLAVKTNVFEKNLIVNIAFPLSTLNGSVNSQGFKGALELVSAKDNYMTNKDPGFVDYMNKNFNLKDDSEVFTKIPGFEKIPYDKIGLIDKVGPNVN